MGNNAVQRKHSEENKIIDGRGTAMASDSIAAKKAQAQKKAMKIIGDAFSGDKKIDDDLNERREKVRTLQKESGENRAAMKDLQDQREKLLEQGYAADSDEVKNLDEQVKSYAELISDTEDEIQMENAVVRQSKIERLKSDPMVKAREQADSVLEAASDEILGDLIAEGKQHIDEKLEEEKKIVRQNISGERVEVRPILKAEDIIAAREVVRQVYLDEKIEQYIADIVFATRYPEKYDLKDLKSLIGFGGSPRASINLALAARSYAFIKRRGYVIPEDVRAVAHDVLRHRIGLTYEAEATNVTSDEIVSKILNKVEVP